MMLIFARVIHFASCLLILGVFAFDTITGGRVLRERLGRRWSRVVRGMVLICLPFALISGAMWLIAITTEMSGRPFSFDDLRLVWNQTHFGTVWKWRLLFWLLVCATTFFPKKWPALICSGFFTASLAWSGHGQTGTHSNLHLLADILHLLSAGFWPMGLLPFLIALYLLRENLAYLTRRFSTASLISVAVLGLSGLANSCFLLEKPGDLFWSSYGRVLMLKVILFVFTVAIGAMNLLCIRPRLDESSHQLRRNIWIELSFSAVIILIVAWLGVLPPALRG